MILIKADARYIPLKDETVQCVVTSPPYWGLRDYGLGDNGIGLEHTPEEYVANIVHVFREVWRVLRKDGTVWLNLGDSYAKGQASDSRSPVERSLKSTLGPKRDGLGGNNAAHVANSFEPRKLNSGLKPKDLVGIPWRVALALQAEGWYLRSDIVWAKPNPMPESVRDRPTKSHEFIFLLSKNQKYYYDQDAVKEQVDGTAHRRGKIKMPDGWDTGPGAHGSFHRGGREKGKVRGVTPKSAIPGSGIKANESFHAATWDLVSNRNLRSVWTIATQPFPGAHFATFPEELAERCIKAGSKPADIILDPFGGSGTTARAAVKLGRRAVHLDLGYHELAKTTRCTQIQKRAF